MWTSTSKQGNDCLGDSRGHASNKSCTRRFEVRSEHTTTSGISCDYSDSSTGGASGVSAQVTSVAYTAAPESINTGRKTSNQEAPPVARPARACAGYHEAADINTGDVAIDNGPMVYPTGFEAAAAYVHVEV